MLDDIRFIATTVSLVTAAGCGALFVFRSKRPLSLRINKFVLALFLLIFVPSFMQVFAWADLYTYLSRDAELIAEGQLWRLITSVMVQSGNVPGLLFNLVGFIVLVPLAARILGPGQAVAFFFVGALAGQAAGLFWLPTGGGNSVGNYGVAAALLAHTVIFAQVPLRIVAATSSLVTIMAMVLLDIHGAAFAVALVCALGYYYPRRKKLYRQIPARKSRRSAAHA